MKTYLECIPCFFHQVIYMAGMASQDERVQKRIIDAVARQIPRFSLNKTPPEMARIIHKIIAREAGEKDFYKEIKEKSNRMALEVYPHLKEKVEASEDRLLTAVEIAIVGNVIDYGAKNSLNIEEEIDNLLSAEIFHLGKTVFDYIHFKEALLSAEKILYLGDNAGETVFDRVFIEEIPDHKEIIYAVRDKPVINDALAEDAVTCGLDKIARVMSSGVDAPGTILEYCSEEFLELFRSADMVISKGQGNYEALNDAGRLIYFLFRAKCPVIARHAEVPVGDVVLMKGRSRER
ncbi:MAG: damage-control phosphatase ARMT1 family protein [Candidatus Omnitrophota bacterium]